jgi:alpha-tubulin suppressor-like RCC1 family protein
MSEEAALVLAPQVGMPHCLVGEDGLTCWGLLTLGLSGFDEQSIEGRYVTEPQALELLPGHVEQLVAAEGYLLAVAEGQAYSWGTESAADLLGRGAPPSPEVPGLIALPGRVTALAAAQDHGCALVDAPAAPVQCWGVGLSGQLGVGDAGDADRVRSPQPVGGLAGRSVAAIEVARGSSCAIVDGGVMCWGEIAGASGSPVAVQGLEPGRLEAVHSLALADGQGCAVDAAGNLACWGAQAVPRARLVRPGMARVRASRDNLCATDREGALFCWGANRRGSLGLGDAAPRSEPTRVSGVSVVDDAFALVGGSQAATCARTSADGDVLCWGANDARQRAVGPWIVRTPLPTLPWEP